MITLSVRCTLSEFRKLNPEVTGYRLYAFEDIPGFYRAGDFVYGNCDDMIVRGWEWVSDDDNDNCVAVWLGS